MATFAFFLPMHGTQLDFFEDLDLPPEPSPQISSENEPQPQPQQEPQPQKTERESQTKMVRVGLDQDLSDRANSLLKNLGHASEANPIQVVWNKRMRSAAGRAHYRDGKIELNPRLQLLEPEKKRDEEIRRTFLHELAHLLAYLRNPSRKIKAHGTEWQMACADLGIPGETVCHDLAFPVRRQRKKYAYKCPACSSTIHRVRRMKKAAACYDCCKKFNRGKYSSTYRLVEQFLG